MTLMLSDLADKDAIRELLARYGKLHATHDFTGVAGLFTADARFENIAGSFTGPVQIQRMYESINPARGARSDRKHYTTDITIALDGNSATATSQFLLVRQCETGMMVAAAGRYEDVLHRTNGEWLFAHRKVHVDFHADMGLVDKETT